MDLVFEFENEFFVFGGKLFVLLQALLFDDGCVGLFHECLGCVFIGKFLLIRIGI